MSGTERVVTEIVVDSRAAVQGIEAVSAAARAGQRAFDSYISGIEKATRAQEQAKASGEGVANTLSTTSRALREAAKSSDTYLGRMDPVMFAHSKLTAELNNAQTALKGVDYLLKTGELAKADSPARVALLTSRIAELNKGLVDLKSSAITTDQGLELLATGFERNQKSAAGLVGEYDRVRSALIPLHAQQLQFVTAQQAIADALNKSIISTAEAAIANERLTGSTAIAVRGMTEYEAAAAKKTESLRQMTAAQAAYNESSVARGGGGLPFSDRQPMSNPLYGAAYDERQADLDAYGKSLDNLRAKYDPLFRVSKQYEEVLAEINYAEKVGAITKTQHATAVEEASKILTGHVDVTGKATASAGQMKFANQQLTVQMSQMFSGIATGQPILITFIQQGHQILDVMWASGISVKQMTESVLGMVKAAGSYIAALPLFITGTVAAGAALLALGAYGESVARDHLKLATTLSATRDDYMRLADDVEKVGKRVSASTDQSVADATAAAGKLAALPIPAGVNANLEGLTKTAAGLAAVLGGSLSDAASKVAGALQDPAKAALALAGTEGPLRTMTAATLASVLALQDAGNKAAAANLVLAAMKTSADVGLQGITPLQKALRELSEAFTRAGEDGKSAFQVMGEAIGGVSAKLVSLTAQVVDFLGGLNEWAKKTGGPAIYGKFWPFPAGGPLPEGMVPTSAYGGTQGGVNFAPGTPRVGNIPTDVSNLIYAAGQKLGARPELVDFATRIAEVESQGQQWNRYGKVLTNDAGALGLMQVMPGSAPPGLDLRDRVQNIEAGLRILMELDVKARGDWAQIAIGYNAGPRRMGGGFIPNETQDYLAKLGLGPSRIPGTLIGGPEGGPTSGFGGATPTSNAPGSTADQTAAVKSISDARAEVTALELKQRQLNEAHATGAIVGADYENALKKINFDLEDAKNKTAAQVRALTDQTAITGIAFEGEKRLATARQEIERQRQSDPQHAITDQQAAEKMAAVQAQMTAEYKASEANLDRLIDAQNKQVRAIAGGTLAADKEKASQEALNVARKSFTQGTPEFDAAYKAYYQRTLELSGGLEKVALAQEHIKNQQQFEVIEAQVKAQGMQSDAAALYVQHVKDMIDVREKLAHQSPDVQANALKERDALAAANQALQQQSSILQYLAGQFDQAFATIGNAITQAFVQGQGAAVNWGNVVKAVVSQVIQAFVQLALINPLKQGLFGSSIASAPTLFNVANTLLGQAPGGGNVVQKDASGDYTSMLSTGGSLVSGGSSVLQAFGYQGIGGQVNALFGGPGTSLLAGTGVDTLGSGALAFLNTPLYGGSGAGLAGGFASDAAISGGAAAGGFAPATTLGGLLGGIAGGVGGGFALGSLSGFLIQGSQNKTGPAPEIGAGVGALAGAGIGLLITAGNPIGALIGGLLGGTLGGSGGGFIGPQRASPYSTTGITMVDGRLGLGQSFNQGDPSSRSAAEAAVNALNDFTNAVNISVTSLGQLSQIGENTPGGFQDPSKFADLASAFPQLRFNSPDPRLSAGIAGRSFATAQELQDAVTRIQQIGAAADQLATVLKNTDAAGRVTEWADRFQALTAADFTGKMDAIASFVTQTVPPLLAMNDNIGSLTAQINGLNDQFGNAIATAADLGYKEAELTSTRDTAIQSLNDAASLQYWQTWTTLLNRQTNAANVFNNAPTDVLKAQALLEFDQAAGLQRQQLASSMIAIHGEAYQNSQAFADEMIRLDGALYYERLNFAKKFDDDMLAKDKAAADAATQARSQAAGSAASAITSLVSYALGLQTSASSPLSPQDQLAFARNQFNAVSGAAGAGDYNSILQLQGFAQTFLDASRVVYGSGAAYVADFQKVIDAIAGVATVGADTLTASVVQITIQTQTDTLVAALGKLQTALDGIRIQLQQNQTQPDRIAA